jgi:hypothetical protein
MMTNLKRDSQTYAKTKAANPMAAICAAPLSPRNANGVAMAGIMPIQMVMTK